MFGELPKLFDRNFAIGYFLPSAAFVGTSLLLVAGFGQLPMLYALFPSIGEAVQKDTLRNTSVIVGLVSLLGAILLLAINREIYKLMEGYGEYNPLQLLKHFEKRRYERRRSELSALDDEWHQCQGNNIDFPQKKRVQRSRLMGELAERFPNEEIYLLPTAFGNTIRAFEVYSRVMHGLEAVNGWNRLIAVIPADYRALIDSAKAQTDFWLNLWVLHVVLLCEYLWLVIWLHRVSIPLVPLTTLIVILFASKAARKAAVEWGNLVKASFDVFLPDLCAKLGFTLPALKNRNVSFGRNLAKH